jgi:hypothetical protein
MLENLRHWSLFAFKCAWKHYGSKRERTAEQGYASEKECPNQNLQKRVQLYGARHPVGWNK